MMAAMRRHTLATRLACSLLMLPCGAPLAGCGRSEAPDRPVPADMSSATPVPPPIAASAPVSAVAEPASTPAAAAWAVALGGVGSDDLGELGIDGAGHLYVAGTVDDALDLGDGPRPAAGAEDIVVARRGPAGEPGWARRFGGPASEATGALVMSSAGRPVIAGTMAATLKLGAHELAVHGVGGDLFVAGLDAAGEVRWARRIGDEFADLLHGMVATRDGGVALLVLSQITDRRGVPELERYRSSLIKVDADGELAWTAALDGMVWLARRPLAATPDGGVVVATTVPAGDAGGGPAAGPVSLKHFAGDGSVAWQRRLPGPCGTSPWLAADPEGGVFLVALAATMERTMDLGAGPLDGSALGFAVLARLAPDGAHLWSRVLARGGLEPVDLVSTPTGVALLSVGDGGAGQTIRRIAATPRVRSPPRAPSLARMTAIYRSHGRSPWSPAGRHTTVVRCMT